MPRYDYRCQACGYEIEVVHGIDGSGPTTSEVCGGAMRKAMSTPAIHFKGSGWAKKDYQAASKAKAKAADSSTTSAGDKAGFSAKGSDGDTPAKPAAGETEKGPAASKAAAGDSTTSTAKTTSKAGD